MVFPESLPSRSVGIHNVPIENPDEIRAGEAEKLPGGVLYDPTLTREIRIGQVLAIHTTTGRAWPIRSTELAAEVVPSATAQDITVDDAHAFLVGDVVTVGDNTPSAILSIDYDANTINMVVNGGTNPTPVDSRVHAPADGLNAAKYIAAERYTPNPAFSSILGQGSVYIAGLFYKNKLKGLDTQADTDLAGYTISRVNDPEGDLYRIG